MERTAYLDLKSPRIRYNWGFHEGADDARRRRHPLWEGARHPDRVYEEGYRAGHAAYQVGKPTDTSDHAWFARERARVAKKADSAAAWEAYKRHSQGYRV